MSLFRFFLDEQILEDEEDDVFPLLLNDGDLKHSKVIRLEIGEHIAVIDASGNYYECEIVSFGEAYPNVRISSHLGKDENEVEITLFQGLIKGDRFDLVLRHATELGVTRFIPLLSKHTVVKISPDKIASKLKRWKEIVRSASKQSGLTFIPTVESPKTIKESASLLAEFDIVLICWEESDTTESISKALSSLPLIEPMRIAIFVGPEGGFRDEEVDELLAGSEVAKLVSLGASILRSETAGIVAPAIVLDRINESICRR